MAKSRSFFGLRRGSTKSHTYQVLNGQQITKDRVSSVANPRTPRQNAQRIVFATVAQAIKFMGPIINHSFEGVPYGARSLNRFAKLNLDRMRQYSALDFQTQPSYDEARCFMTTKNVSALIPNRYIMSTGSLTLDPKSANAIGGAAVLPFSNGATIQYDAEGTTLGQVLNAFYGFTRPGQQLTKCFIVCRSGKGYDKYVWGGAPTVPGTVIPTTSFIAARLVLNDSVNWSLDVHALNEAGIKAAILNAFDAEKSDTALLDGCCTSTRMTVAEGEISLDSLQNVKTIFGIDAAAFVAAETTILSEPYGTNWLRSNSELKIVAKPDPEHNYGLTWYEANKAWSAGPAQNADNERYLNEGGESNQIGY